MFTEEKRTKSFVTDREQLHTTSKRVKEKSQGQRPVREKEQHQRGAAAPATQRTGHVGLGEIWSLM